jgi:hypothetical protein
MAGLLDFGAEQPGGIFGGLLSDPGARLGLSMLAASSPKLRGLADVMAQQDRMQQQQQEAAWMKTVRDRKTKEWGREDAAAERAAQVQAAIPGLFGTTTQGSVSTPNVGGVPFFSRGTNVERPSMRAGGFNVQEALRMGMQPRQIQELAELENLGRQEVARTVEGTDSQGRPVTYQFDKFGRPVGQAVGQWKAPVFVNQGDRQTIFDPAARQTMGSLSINMSPSERDASARGWAGNALTRQRLEFDMRGGAETGKPQYRDGQWVMPPANMQPGQSVPAIPTAGVKDAKEALELIDQATKLIPNATGSYIGTAADAGARAFGISTKGDMATGQLQALEGALVAKMPKMSGPQSDKDVALYRQMAGVIGDPTIPTERKLAALQTVEEIQRRYAGTPAPRMPAPGAMGSGTFGSAPPDITNLLNKYGGR